MKKVKAYVAVIVIQLSFAGTFLLLKASLSSGMKPSIFVAYRQAFATLALAPFLFFFNRNEDSCPPLTWKALCKIFIISSYGLTLSMNLNFAGLKYTSATFNTALLNIVPPLVFIMAVFLRIEKLEIKEWHGIAKVFGGIIGICGAMVFTLYKGPPLYYSSNSSMDIINISTRNYSNAKTNHHSKQEWIKGSLLSLSAQFSWSLWLTMQGLLVKQYPGKLRLTILQCGFSCVTATIYGAATERNISSWKLGWNFELLSIAYCGIIVAGIMYWLQAWVIETKGPVFSAIFSPLALILSAIISAIFLHEILHWGSVLGGGLLVCGLYSLLWGRNREEAQSGAQKQQSVDEEQWKSHTNDSMN